MALGKIKADTLEHSTAGSLDTQYIVAGSPRAWFQANLETPVIQQSINIASITDVASGRHDFTYTNNFLSADYASATGGGGSTSNFTLANVSTPTDAKLTSKVRTDTMYAHGASYVFDPAACCVNSIGDLA